VLKVVPEMRRVLAKKALGNSIATFFASNAHSDLGTNEEGLDAMFISERQIRNEVRKLTILQMP